MNRSSKKPDVRDDGRLASKFYGAPGDYDITVRKGMQPFSPRLRTKLRWSIGQQINNVGAIFANIVLEPTWIYNMVGSGALSIPFFAALSAIYRYYRVRAWTLTASFANSETFNVVSYLLPTNSAPGSNSAAWAAYLSDPLCKMALMGPLTGLNSRKLTQHTSVQTFSGSLDTGTDDLYSGTTSGTAPTNNTFHIVGIQSPSAVVFVNGVTVQLHIEVELDFFELATPAT
jgi:hypothetical protein